MSKPIHPLRAARLARRMTLQELAVRAQCDVGNLSKIENWHLARPSPETAERIVAVFPEHLTELHLLYPERYVQREAAS